MSKKADFTIVIPTAGRHTLTRCLESMLPQNQSELIPEIIVVEDTYETGQSYAVQILCQQYNVRYLSYNASTHNWGYPQLQHGYAKASKKYIFNIGDDDIYEENAFVAMQEEIEKLATNEELVPLMFRAIMHPSITRGNMRPITLWQTPELKRQNVTGQNFGCPNIKSLIGFWWDDFCQMEATINNFQGKVAWIDKVIAQCY